MDSLDRKCLISCYTFLVSDIDLDPILAHLIGDCIITVEQIERIQAEKTSTDKTRQFLKILPNCGPEAFDKFIQALQKTGQEHVVEYLLHIKHEERKHQSSKTQEQYETLIKDVLVKAFKCKEGAQTLLEEVRRRIDDVIERDLNMMIPYEDEVLRKLIQECFPEASTVCEQGTTSTVVYNLQVIDKTKGELVDVTHGEPGSQAIHDIMSRYISPDASISELPLNVLHKLCHELDQRQTLLQRRYIKSTDGKYILKPEEIAMIRWKVWRSPSYAILTHLGLQGMTVRELEQNLFLLHDYKALQFLKLAMLEHNIDVLQSGQTGRVQLEEKIVGERSLEMKTLDGGKQEVLPKVKACNVLLPKEQERFISKHKDTITGRIHVSENLLDSLQIEGLLSSQQRIKIKGEMGLKEATSVVEDILDGIGRHVWKEFMLQKLIRCLVSDGQLSLANYISSKVFEEIKNWLQLKDQTEGNVTQDLSQQLELLNTLNKKDSQSPSMELVGDIIPSLNPPLYDRWLSLIKAYNILGTQPFQQEGLTQDLWVFRDQDIEHWQEFRWKTCISVSPKYITLEGPQKFLKQKTIAVKGFRKHTTEDTLKLFFENTKRSGGGEIENITKLDDVAYITFTDPEAARCVVEHEPFSLQGAILNVRLEAEPIPHSSDERVKSVQRIKKDAAAYSGTRTIAVIDSSKTLSSLTQAIFFSSMTGDKIEKVVQYGNTTYLTFVDADVAKGVLEEQHYRLMGQLLIVKSPAEATSQLEQKNDETFSLTFGKGSINILKSVEKTAVVKFLKPEAVQHVLAKKDLLLRGQVLEIDEYKPKLLNLDPRVIEVRGFTAETAEQVLHPCNWGEREDIEHVTRYDTVAYITFRTAKAATWILSHGDRTIHGVKVTVSRKNKPVVHVTVKSIPPSVKEEDLKLFLESEKVLGENVVDSVTIMEGQKDWDYKEKETEAYSLCLQSKNLQVEFDVKRLACISLQKLDISMAALQYILSSNVEILNLEQVSLNYPMKDKLDIIPSLRQVRLMNVHIKNLDLADCFAKTISVSPLKHLEVYSTQLVGSEFIWHSASCPQELKSLYFDERTGPKEMKDWAWSGPAELDELNPSSSKEFRSLYLHHLPKSRDSDVKPAPEGSEEELLNISSLNISDEEATSDAEKQVVLPSGNVTGYEWLSQDAAVTIHEQLPDDKWFKLCTTLGIEKWAQWARCIYPYNSWRSVALLWWAHLSLGTVAEKEKQLLEALEIICPQFAPIIKEELTASYDESATVNVGRDGGELKTSLVHLTIPKGAMSKSDDLCLKQMSSTILRHHLQLYDFDEFIQMERFYIQLYPHGKAFSKSIQIKQKTRLIPEVGRFLLMLYKKDDSSDWEAKLDDFRIDYHDGQIVYYGKSFCYYCLLSLWEDMRNSIPLILNCFNGKTGKVFFRVQYKLSMSYNLRLYVLCTSSEDGKAIFRDGNRERDISQEKVSPIEGSAWSDWNLIQGAQVNVKVGDEDEFCPFNINHEICQTRGQVKLFDCRKFYPREMPIINILNTSGSSPSHVCQISAPVEYIIPGCCGGCQTRERSMTDLNSRGAASLETSVSPEQETELLKVFPAAAAHSEAEQETELLKPFPAAAAHSVAACSAPALHSDASPRAESLPLVSRQDNLPIVAVTWRGDDRIQAFCRSIQEQMHLNTQFRDFPDLLSIGQDIRPGQHVLIVGQMDCIQADQDNIQALLRECRVTVAAVSPSSHGAAVQYHLRFQNVVFTEAGLGGPHAMGMMAQLSHFLNPAFHNNIGHQVLPYSSYSPMNVINPRSSSLTVEQEIVLRSHAEDYIMDTMLLNRMLQARLLTPAQLNKIQKTLDLDELKAVSEVLSLVARQPCGDETVPKFLLCLKDNGHDYLAEKIEEELQQVS